MKNKKYHQRYRLLVDLPTGQKKGHELTYIVNENYEMLWYFCQWCDVLKEWDYKIDRNSTPFTLDQISNTDFFEPIGKELDLILPFPNKEEIKDYYYLIGESRLVNDVPQVRFINPIFYSDEFYDKVYELLKQMYHEKYPNNF